MRIAASEDSFRKERTIRFEECGVATYLTHIFQPDTDAGTQVRYMQLGPWGEVKPHFHLADQYQIFTHGIGTFGKKQITPLSVHYADRYTPYGPILTGPEGLSWFTVRLAGDVGANYMPESRHMMVSRPERTVTALAEIPYPTAEKFIMPVLKRYPDGVGADLVWTPPGEKVECSVPEDGGGQVHIVFRGSVTVDGRALDAKTCLRLDPGESWAGVAGDKGTLVLCLGFRKGAESIDKAVLAEAAKSDVATRIREATLATAG